MSESLELKTAKVPWSKPISKDFHVTVYKDAYPVTEGHLLFVPNYNHHTSIQKAFKYAMKHGDKLIKDGEIDGFNIGINWGEAAGQTVMYPHVHFIPRRKGDCEDPTGGIRGVIPGKANYKI